MEHNKVYDANNQPIWLSEQIDERQKAMHYIIEMANMSPLTSVERDKNLAVPEGFQLFQNYPNPFNPVTTSGVYAYELTTNGTTQHKSMVLIR